MAKKSFRERLPKLTTKAKIIVGLVVIVFGALIVVFIITSSLARQLNNGDGSAGVSEDFTKKDTTTRKTDALSAADPAAQSGNSNQIIAIYDKAISAETNPVAKVGLAADEAALLLQAHEPDKAIAAMTKAENFDTDKFLYYDRLARLYQDEERYADAAKYFALAGTLVGSPNNIGKYNKSYYDSKADLMKKAAANT